MRKYRQHSRVKHSKYDFFFFFEWSRPSSLTSTRSEADLTWRLISSTHWWQMELGEMMSVAPVETGVMATRQWGQ